MLPPAPHARAQVSFSQLCDLFFSRIDPKARNRQGNDVGTQYRSGIYYHSEAQRQVAEERCAKIPGCAVEVAPAGVFYPAGACVAHWRMGPGSRRPARRSVRPGADVRRADPPPCRGVPSAVS